MKSFLKILFVLFLLTPSKASANDNEIQIEEMPEEPDMCVGCNDDEESEAQSAPQVTVEIQIDPMTGKIYYIVRGLVIE